MPPRIYDLAVTVPAGTPQSAPVSVPWVTENNTIVDIELEVPPGHNGLTGLRVMKGDVQLVPWGVGTFIIANNYTRTFQIGAYLSTGDVTVQAYNTGQYPHTFYLRMTVTDYDVPAVPSTLSQVATVPAGTITATPDPLSPDAILGPDAAAAVTDGTLTAEDLTPIDPSNLTLPPAPQPTGI